MSIKPAASKGSPAPAPLAPAAAEQYQWAPDLFELSQDLLCIIGADGFFKRLNPAWERSLGFTPADLMAKPFVEFVHPDDRLGTMARAAAITEAEPLLHFENRYECRDGSYRWVSWTAAAKRDPDILFAVGRDVTDRKRAEFALAESEEVFRTLFEQASVGIVLDDISAGESKSRSRENNRVREMLGVEQVTYSAWASAVNPEAWQDHLEKYRSLLAGEIRELRERRELHRPDGTRIWADMSTILIRDEAGQPSHSQTHLLDVTEQIEAQERLLKRGAQQAILLELSRAGLEGLEATQFLSVAIELVARGTEMPFATLLELRLAENRLVRVAAYGCGEVIPTEPAPLTTAKVMFDALQSGTPVLLFDYVAEPELEMSTWMKNVGVAASMAVGISGPVNPYGVLSVYSDSATSFSEDDIQFMLLASTIISVAVERSRAEQQRRLLLARLVTAQEVERRTIAEDIHDDAVQVLTAANIRLELFRSALTDPGQIDAAESLQEAVTLATGRLRNMLFDLNPPDLERHGLAAALQRRLELLAADVGVRCSLVSELDGSPGQDVRIILFRIFQEGLANVRKQARASAVSATLAPVDGGILMTLADDGIGFLPESTEPRSGHLGLASMRERAEMAGGWLRLVSQPGSGTRISAWVPSPPEEGAASDHDLPAMLLPDAGPVAPVPRPRQPLTTPGDRGALSLLAAPAAPLDALG